MPSARVGGDVWEAVWLSKPRGGHDNGLASTGSTPEAYLDKLRFETERWTKVVRDNNIKVEG